MLLEDLLDALQLTRGLHIEEEDGNAHDQQQASQEEEHPVAHRAQLAAQQRQASDLTRSNFKFKLKFQNRSLSSHFWSTLFRLFGILRIAELNAFECSDSETNARPDPLRHIWRACRKLPFPLLSCSKSIRHMCEVCAQLLKSHGLQLY